MIILAALLPVSCDLFNPNKETVRETLYEDSFYAQNMQTDEFYEIKASRLVDGEKCVIWAEAGSGVTKASARKIAEKYDTIIRPRIVDAFSEKNFTADFNGSQQRFDDILDYANRYTGGKDGKLTILLLDIKDGYDSKKNNSYVAGYFFSGDFQRRGDIGYGFFSNGRDMIYIDTNPGLKMKPEQTYATFAHELQHLINYITSVRINRKYLQDTWVDEGLSSHAEYLYLGKNPEDKCEWFSEDKNGTIAEGNNFFVWGNYMDGEESLSILDDYSTVYLFFRWLYLQADEELKPRLFREIISSDQFDYRAVTNVASQINPKWEDWETLLRTWFAANYAPSNTLYGYKGDSYLQSTIKVTPIAGDSIDLYPGEGVYSIINNPFPTKSASASIRYAGLARNGTILGTDSPYTGNMLLTFNVNTNNKKSTPATTGQLTGVKPPAAAGVNGAARTVEAGGPYVIDARDLLGREKAFPPTGLQPLR